MRNFSVPKYWIIRKNWFLDLLQGFMLVLTFSWLFYDSLYAFFPLLPLLWLWHKERALARKQKEEEQFKKMFREWILLLASSLSAGYSVENAMKQSMTDLSLMFPEGGAMLEEVKSMLAKAENNQSPEMLLEEFASHYPLEEVESFVEVFCTARVSGGSLNAIIRSTAAQMAEIMDTRREIATLLASKVYEQRIMTVMPLAVLLYLRIGSREFLEGLYHNIFGVCVSTVCLIIYLGAYWMGKRMVQFEI